MTRFMKILRQRRKAAAAVLLPLVAYGAQKAAEELGDLTLPSTWPKLVVWLLTGVAVHEIPNDPQEG